MGFTIWWKVTKEISQEQWAKVADDLIKLEKHINKNNLDMYYICESVDRTHLPMLLMPDKIMFTGKVDGREEFIITREPIHAFAKTYRKPYSVIVCAALLLFEKYASDCVLFTCDDTPDDIVLPYSGEFWDRAKELLTSSGIMS